MIKRFSATISHTQRFVYGMKTLNRAPQDNCKFPFLPFFTLRNLQRSHATAHFLFCLLLLFRAAATLLFSITFEVNLMPCLKKPQTFLIIITSVGPAYIMGEGKMATMVDSGFRTPSSSTAACCFILQGSGTSSSLVQPPSGWSSRTGRR